jgi:hypothetical protein
MFSRFVRHDARRWKEVTRPQNAAVEHFQGEHWLELGALTGWLDAVKRHDRLLRSLSWGDPDYGTHAFSILTDMVQANPSNLDVIDQYISRHFPAGGINVSSVDIPGKRIYFTPSVFQIPAADIDPNLLSVMMPFGANFDTVHMAVTEASRRNGMSCLRADDIWVDSTIIQDVFSLIYRSCIVVCDFTGRNPNVLYEAGIAHTLGKHVIPITQYPGDIPFDLQAHRFLQYHNNAEGHMTLTDNLSSRIETLRSGAHQKSWI